MKTLDLDGSGSTLTKNAGSGSALKPIADLQHWRRPGSTVVIILVSVVEYGSGSGQLGIILPDPDMDRHPGPADPDPFQSKVS
jgi:hypothetical protein